MKMKKSLTFNSILINFLDCKIRLEISRRLKIIFLVKEGQHYVWSPLAYVSLSLIVRSAGSETSNPDPEEY